MAYTKFTKKSVTKELGTNQLVTQRKLFSSTPDTVQFYELEPAVVLDVIRDEKHPIFSDKELCPKVKSDEWPNGYNNEGDIDYSWIGRIKARGIFSQNKSPMVELSWILPLETGVKEYPLVNENVVIVKYINNIYYTRRINSRNFLNNSADFRTEPRYGAGNKLSPKNCPNLKGAKNPSVISSASNEFGQYLGKYFKANNKIRPLRHFEGDTIIESRIGNSIRFSCYEDNPSIDAGTSKGNGEDYSGNLGNPMILIRNRPCPKKGNEKIYSHTVLEDINLDGSSIHITSGKTVSKFVPTLGGTGGGGGAPKKKAPKNFKGLSKVAQSAGGQITDSVSAAANTTGAVAKAGMGLAESAGKAYVQSQLAGPMAAYNAAKTGMAVAGAVSSAAGGISASSGGAGGGIYQPGPGAAAKHAAKGDYGGSLGASFGTAIGPSDGMEVGNRFNKMGMANTSKIVNVEGVSSGGGAGMSGVAGVTGAAAVGSSINSSQGKSKFLKGVGTGNFSLNSVYESGLTKALKKGKSAGKNHLFKKTKAGRALSAANSLGIGVDGFDDLGINSEDSSMFKLFKLASFGVKSICATAKKKKEFGSDTEEQLGWMLSFGINLELLALLMAIFERLRNLKFNFGLDFGAMFAFNLDKLTFDLCDWVNQVEYGSTLTDTLKGEATKFLDPNVSSAKDQVKAVGDNFSEKGILGAFTKNDKDFDQQYTSIITEEEKAQLKAAGASFGSMGLSLKKGNDEVATMGFDPLTGLFRNKGASPFSSGFNFGGASVASVTASRDLGDIKYNSFNEGVQFNSGASGAITGGAAAASTVGRIGGSTSVGSASSGAGANASANASITSPSGGGSMPSFSSSQPSASTPSSSTPSSSTPTSGSGSSSSGTRPNNTNNPPPASASNNIKSSSSNIRPSASDNTRSAPQNPSSVKSIHNGAEITAESLAGTPIAGADLNAVACLAPVDLETLKDAKAVGDSIAEAKNVKKNTFNNEMDAVEEEVIGSAGGLMFGKQLPKLDGNQIIINSERVIISSKSGEFVTFAKGKYGIATDDEMTFDALQRIVTQTQVHTSVISPTIHLGAYITRRHPVLKGDVAVGWLSGLCGWLSGHVHNDPYITTSSPAQQGQLSGLRARLPTLLSSRVFIDG